MGPPEGSVAALTGSSGSVTHSYAYDPYGMTTETTSSSGVNPWRYAGQYQDTATGLYKMGAGYYQPALGRWTQQDPSGQVANAYLYGGNNPVNFVDPTGFIGISTFTDIIAGADDFFDAANDVVTGRTQDLVDDAAGLVAGVGTESVCLFGAGAAGVFTGRLATAAGLGICAVLGAGVDEVVQDAVDKRY